MSKNYTLAKRTLLSALGFGLLTVPALAQNSKQLAKVSALADKVEPKVIEWRRDFHEHPELGNQEKETAAKIAAHLKKLGMEVETGVAKTGVVGVLKGGKPGPVVALRADIDGLPVTERTDIPFASKAKGVYNGQEVGVMHACGHDTHIAMLMGAAEVLASMKKDLPGTVKFIFQPAEEGSPVGEEGGAKLMVKEGVLEKGPKPEVIFGLHINSQTEVGQIKYRPGGTMASADIFRIKVNGKQVHGAYPWNGVDPIVTSAQIINGLQTIISRQTELLEDAAVVTVGMIHGGVRNNIIPEEVHLEGTIRTLNTDMQQKIHEKIRLTATKIAESAGATAEVSFIPQTPVTYNDPALTQKMLPTLQATAGKENVILTKAVTGAEDFAFFQEKIPGLYVFVGGMPKGQDPATAAPHHTPDFFIDESGLKLGVKTLTNLTLDYMNSKGKSS
ncbi:carboxypeptidase Ss1 [Pontibacter ummariensis]|uniref:Carboxypeptidase Ss1. Metallo peptidase. MEROPS family M20D n=1 Tax=Pontibacter ummariensis TaxID=1610492 RepID=A0A239E5D4_9BACT|nr:amidohydrolase [Pontibacter ummariensis]PRY13090.1 carboxypeptidase Ss1 [Pontibacter ummariensis]SNS39837.1 carboxypeptidase Ss1. Metallo peptidase. MEROPS family M20D [Pontibacter ummariensis]